MITANQIAHLRTASEDYPLTEDVKAELQAVRERRQPFYLTAKELERVFEWKLRSQYGRQATERARNSDDVYTAVTRAAFEVEGSDWNYEATVRIGVLSALPGVGVPVASAIVALAEPDRYCVIDFRGWRAVFGTDRRIFSVANYRHYVAEVDRLARELGWPVQETDLALWEYDRRTNP